MNTYTSMGHFKPHTSRFRMERNGIIGSASTRNFKKNLAARWFAEVGSIFNTFTVLAVSHFHAAHLDTSKLFDGQQTMKNEKRKAYRRAIRQTVMMLNSDKSMVGLCTMLDVSSTGARIKPPLASEVPNEFILLLTKDGKVRRQCKISWRTETEIGVHFVVCPSKDNA